MQNKENIDNMARRYKDEMMRIYRMNCGSPTPPCNPSCSSQTMKPPKNPCSESNAPSQTPSCPPPCQTECKFSPAQDLVCGNDRPQVLPSFVGNAVPTQTDLTPSMINGTGCAADSLASDGVPNFDSYNNSLGMNSSGEQINVYPESNSAMNRPAAEAATAPLSTQPASDGFSGVMINPVTASSTDDTANMQSDVFSEQLPDFELPPDIEVGSDMPDTLSSRYVISNNWINLTGDNGWGFLQFEVTTGSLGSPVQNATVVVSRIVNNRSVLTRIVTTCYNGLTRTLILPAPRYVYNPYRPSSYRPFAEYRASVFANGYYPLTNIQLMVYAGIKSVQPVDLIPLPQYSPNPGIQPRSGS